MSICFSGVLAVFLAAGTSVSGQIRPPNFSPDAIPDTRHQQLKNFLNRH
jgi:hypothetical protein